MTGSHEVRGSNPLCSTMRKTSDRLIWRSEFFCHAEFTRFAKYISKILIILIYKLKILIFMLTYIKV